MPRRPHTQPTTLSHNPSMPRHPCRCLGVKTLHPVTYASTPRHAYPRLGVLTHHPPLTSFQHPISLCIGVTLNAYASTPTFPELCSPRLKEWDI
ncbi:hypothetical protein PIB30_091858, partial [Stylosanthes scabra]|nr:hypothetical protein [Stylosanthes scabra]